MKLHPHSSTEDRLNAHLEDGERAERLAEMACPRCSSPVEDHWTLSVDAVGMQNWDDNAQVCQLSLGDVTDLIESSERGESCE